MITNIQHFNAWARSVMNKSLLWGVPLAALLICFSPSAYAQDDMSFGLEEAESDEGVSEEMEDPGLAGDEDAGGDEDLDLGGDDMGLGGDFLNDDGGDDDTERTEGDTVTTDEEIYAVQQLYALRINRVELAPSFAFTINDPYTSRRGFGVGFNYWWTNVLAVGLNFLWYQGLEQESDLNFFVRRSTRLAVPITEWQMGAHLNFTYVPLYGKFGMFNNYIFQWDSYIIGGVGFMRTRPVPVIDPDFRDFEFGMRIAFNVGLGLRVFLSRYFSVFTEFRNYMYLERLENLSVGLGESRADDTTWFRDSAEFTNNLSVQLGVTIFFPFNFEYRLPK